MNSQELRALQEAYSQVYDEGYKSFPHGKVEAKAKRLGADSRTNEPLTGKSDSEVDSILARKKKSGERATSLNLASRTAHSYLPQKKAERNKTQKEQADLYDIILSHLLDEGYAETPEAAEAIMVNMSEDWRESIVEDAGIVSGLVGLALGAKGALHAAKKTKRLRDYPKNFVKGIADPRTYIPNKKKDKGG